MNEQVRGLKKLGRNVAHLAMAGQLTGKPVAIGKGPPGLVGPRAGVMFFNAGLAAGDVLNALGKNDCATLRQVVPWQFTGRPSATMQGRYIRVEAGWPADWSLSLVTLSSLKQIRRSGTWSVGLAETGQTVTVSLDDRKPSFLVSGQTGSGKSVALRSAVFQLGQNSDDRLVLCDGKFGESLKPVERVRGVVGPVAVDAAEIRAALGWACLEMRRRYERGHEGKIIVVFDEFQRFADDTAITGLLSDIVSLGRAAGVHAILATQHPSLAAFKTDNTRRNLVGRIAFRVGDYDASRVAVGDVSPRADWLLGAGDGYTITPGACDRTQAVFTDGHNYDESDGTWEFDAWPEFDAESAGQQELPAAVGGFDGDELATSIISASESEGRPSLLNRLEAIGLSRPGAERGIRLLRIGREAYDGLQRQCYSLAKLVS
uniref:Putative DNA translocase n=1 Tax=viral metagenome TaxID=1070528 RepID=A0A6M3XZ04_9ZZZZ